MRDHQQWKFDPIFTREEQKKTAIKCQQGNSIISFHLPCRTGIVLIVLQLEIAWNRGECSKKCPLTLLISSPSKLIAIMLT